jgi:ribosomal protein S18 acetylase RimI-like enzyme
MSARTTGSAIRPAMARDLDALDQLERRCFDSDRLTRRRLSHWIKASHGILHLYEDDQGTAAYGLVWLLKGTRLARLYSLAVDPRARGRGIGEKLLRALELAAADRGRLYMRLEVAKSNQSAIRLYERSGYRVFGEYTDYYQDHDDALRMHKQIVHLKQQKLQKRVPWYRQTTEFTCGPASLMMAMSSLDVRRKPEQMEELAIWREATTIFMTSGHGGCHPLGLALAAQRRGFAAEVTLSQREPLFIEGVRREKKKDIISKVDRQFLKEARAAGVTIRYCEVTQQQLEDWMQEGRAVLVLISTYRLDGKKTPHWVCLTGLDEHCLYVHDPDCEEGRQVALDCQHLPISRQDFARMSAFGRGRLRTAIAITPGCDR